ncbi:MAG TPA: hypothetical protein VFS59_04680 [Gemmatimonadaceae bacterium]|nr:hypothetical protein [Gemmatimonadaceae bacterium]
MRPPDRRRTGTLTAAGILLLALGSTGCATLRTTLRGYDVGPNGIARPQHRLREALVTGDFVRALKSRDEDELLDRLTRATTAYYAGQFLRAGALLDTAALASDDRITGRLSRDALAMVTNDNARPYRPRRTERLFIPYYGMLAYAGAESWSDAAVEARRLVALLAQHESDRDESERPLHAMLEHLSGAVLERAGYADEAQVAYRAANRMLAAAPERLARPGRDEGELLVVLERGFVAHRVTEKIDLYVGDDDAHRRDRDDDADCWISVAFPVLRHSARPWPSPARLRLEAGEADHTVRLVSVVDDAASADERRDRLAMLARATARAGAKYALAKVAKDRKGELAGTLANYGASLLERADVRSWHLLPQEIQLLRTRLRPGTHAVRVEVMDGGMLRAVELGTVTVHAGATSIVPLRIWREGGAAPLLAKR